MTHNLSSTHHSFDIELASKYGVEEAILIHHFHHWIDYNRRMNRNFYEGKTWTYQTLEEIAAHFPYITKDRVRDLVEKLCTGKSRYAKDEVEFEPVLVKGNFNKTKFDKTCWYTFKNEEFITKGGSPKSMMSNPQIRFGESPTPIPHSETGAAKTKQQQQAAVDTLYKIFECLQSVDIPEVDKLWITKNHKQDDVKHAVAWSLHPSTKINKELAAAIKWACKEKPAIPKTESDVMSDNYSYAQEIAVKYNGKNGYGICVLGKYIEITSYPYEFCLKYTECAFRERLDNELRKRDIMEIQKGSVKLNLKLA